MHAVPGQFLNVALPYQVLLRGQASQNIRIGDRVEFHDDGWVRPIRKPLS